MCGDGHGRPLVVPGKHDRPDVHGLEGLEGLLGVLLRRVSHRNYPGQTSPDCEKHGSLPLLLVGPDGALYLGEVDLVLLHQFPVAKQDVLPRNDGLDAMPWNSFKSFWLREARPGFLRLPDDGLS